MQYQEETIAAIATPFGEAGVSIIRVSGPGATEIVEKVYEGPKALNEFTSHKLYYGKIIDGDKLLDRALVCLMKAPHSYTGEDVVEIHIHGSPYLASKVLELLIKKGARVAESGEFTKRAFLNGKMDLAQAEAVLDIVQAQAASSLEVAQAQREGRLSREIEELREGLKELLTGLEAFIDFSQDGVEPVKKEAILGAIDQCSKRLKDLIRSYEDGKLYRHGLLVPILGRPNVGKSSLFNALLGHDRAIVTKHPGTTRDLIDDVMRLGGFAIRLQDTAGIRVDDEVEEVEVLGVGKSKKAAKQAQLAIFIIDGHEGINKKDIEVFNEHVKGKPAIIAINKADLEQQKNIQEEIKKEFPDLPMTSLSSKTGKGLEELENLLVDKFRKEQISEGQVIITHLRHKEALAQASQSLQGALESIGKKLSEEFTASDLRSALDHLGEITGAVTTEDILDTIFSQFCIGK